MSGILPALVCMVVSRQSRCSRCLEATHQACATIQLRPTRVTAGTETALVSARKGTHRPPPTAASSTSASPAVSRSSVRIRQSLTREPERSAAGRSPTAG
ncbi:hypothetical protein GCM10020219_050640 [Nonomuraea dietziae]